MDALGAIDIMKTLKDFDKLNSYVLGQAKKFELKGNSKFKNLSLTITSSTVTFKNDITNFELVGEGFVTRKSLIKSEVFPVTFKLDTSEKTLETNFKDKNALLTLLILIYFDFLKQYAKKAKEVYYGS